MVYLRRGEGGPPTPSPPKASWGLLLIGPFPPTGPFCFSIKTPVPFHVFTLMDDPVQKPNKGLTMMAQSKPCVMCKKPAQAILMCCEQPCHLTCAIRWGKESTNPDAGCFRCRSGNSIPVLEILNEEWKEDSQFVKEVKRNWYEHTIRGVTHHLYPLWYGIGYELKCGEPICWGGVQGFWGKHRNSYSLSREPHFLGHTPSEAISTMKQLNPFPTVPCVVCQKSVSNQIILTCCRYSCHVACADNWRKNPHLITRCAYIPQGHSTTVIEILNYDWKEDPQFVKEVDRIWNGSLWYGICHTGTGAAQGFWGKIFKNPDTSTNIPHFLGHTPSEVLSHMKNILSSQ